MVERPDIIKLGALLERDDYLVGGIDMGGIGLLWDIKTDYEPNPIVREGKRMIKGIEGVLNVNWAVIGAGILGMVVGVLLSRPIFETTQRIYQKYNR